MNKHKLHHVLTVLRKINYTVLFVLLAVFALISLFALRANNQKMITYRSAVFAADKDNGDVETALKDLRKYVFAHMNTNLSSGFSAVKPPIQLKYHYERLAAAAKAEYDNANTIMLAQAETTCVAQYPGSVYSQQRLNCAKDYAAAHPVTLKSIPEDQYKFDFASPFWSPDWAGWSLVAVGSFLFLIIARYLSEVIIRQELD